MKILILLLYWERPVMVKNALRSILRANEHHQDWQLAFIDDSSPTPGRPVCEEILHEHLDQVAFYDTQMTAKEKVQTGGMVGKLMNRAVAESDAEVAIMLCDDDELHPEYLHRLSDYFLSHDVDACYSHIIPFNPIFESSEHAPPEESELNHTGYIQPFTMVDASQVAWRTTISAKFNENQTKCLDACFYRQLPLIPFSGFVGQYKGVHVSQLAYWKCEDVWAGRIIDTPNGEVLTPVQAICPIISKYLKAGNKEQARQICEKAISLHPHHTELYLLLREAS